MEKPILYYWAPCSTCSVAVNLADELGISSTSATSSRKPPTKSCLRSAATRTRFPISTWAASLSRGRKQYWQNSKP